MLFADAGLSAGHISTLLLVWSTVSIVAEVPSGALADRFSRRAALAAAGVLQAAGYVLWIAAPGYPAFAAGFVVWGLGSTLSSGALEALLYDDLASVGAERHYPRLHGRITAAGLLSQLPSAAAATALFATGGYDLVGWVSVACCLGAAALATRLPEVRPQVPPGAAQEAGDPEPSYLAVLRSGLAEAGRRPAVRGAILAVAVLGGLDGVEEYFPLLARDWGVTTSIVPLAVVGIPMVGAAGAALAGATSRVRPRAFAALLAVAVVLFTAAGWLQRPIGMLGIAVAYGLYQLVLVVTDARLQERIEGPARATVTSVAALGTEVGAACIFLLWALDLPALTAAIALATAVSLPRLLRPPATVAAQAPAMRGVPR